jgi:hypothetical protein
MRQIPVVSSDEGINAIVRTECARFGSDFSPVFFRAVEPILEFVKYELPDLKILNFSDRAIDCMLVLKEIQDDPWLHYGSIIAVHDDNADKAILDRIRDANIVAVLPRREFIKNLGRLLRVIRQNKQILFQRGFQLHLLKSMSGELIMDNDPLDITTYANLITNYLYNANLIGKEEKERLHVTLLELLINAVEHGNCRIGFEEKSAWLESGKDIMELMRKKNADPAIKARKVKVEYTIAPDRSSFSIEDEGEGFDWRARFAKKADEPGLHGMGIGMARHYVENLAYSERGNRVSFSIEHRKAETNTMPRIFAQSEEIKVKDGQYVCQEGEESDFLYYIVSGTFYVYSRGKLVSSLSPDDIFLGEMSFLLSNRRSATVVARGSASLVKISKQDFVNMIKENPHYGIFLARLLAQRLARLNVRTVRLNAEYQKLKAEKAGPASGPASQEP